MSRSDVFRTFSEKWRSPGRRTRAGRRIAQKRTDGKLSREAPGHRFQRLHGWREVLQATPGHNLRQRPDGKTLQTPGIFALTLQRADQNGIKLLRIRRQIGLQTIGDGMHSCLQFQRLQFRVQAAGIAPKVKVRMGAAHRLPDLAGHGG